MGGEVSGDVLHLTARNGERLTAGRKREFQAQPVLNGLAPLRKRTLFGNHAGASTLGLAPPWNIASTAPLHTTKGATPRGSALPSSTDQKKTWNVAVPSTSSCSTSSMRTPLAPATSRSRVSAPRRKWGGSIWSLLDVA